VSEEEKTASVPRKIIINELKDFAESPPVITIQTKEDVSLPIEDADRDKKLKVTQEQIMEKNPIWK